MSLTPENSNAGWPSFGEHFTAKKDSAYRWMNFGAQATVNLPACPREFIQRDRFMGVVAISILMIAGSVGYAIHCVRHKDRTW